MNYSNNEESKSEKYTRVKEELSNKYGKNELDERQNRLENSMISKGGLVIFIYLLVYYIYMFSTAQNVSLSGIYLVLMLISFPLYFYFIVKDQYKGRLLDVFKTNILRMDEREKENVLKALNLITITLVVVAMFVFLFKLILRYPLISIRLELGILFIFGLFVTFYPYLKKDYTLDSDSFYERKVEKADKENKRFRLIKYAKNSFTVPLGLLIIEILYPSQAIKFKFLNNSVFLSRAFSFVASFIFIFALNYCWEEHKLKKHMKYLESLEE